MTREMLLEVVAFHQLIRDEVGDGGVASLLSLMF